MKLMNILSCVVMAALLSASAKAACGGGGYSPAKTNVSSNVQASSSSSSSGITGKYSSSFDVSYFHNMSGQLHMSGQQATAVIGMIQDIRRTLDASATPPKDFDPKKEFEKRLATILNADQIRTYQTNTSVQTTAKKS